MKKLASGLVLILGGCAVTPSSGFGSRVPAPAPTPTPTPTPSPTPSPVATFAPTVDVIKKLAEGSECAKHSFPDRGVMYRGFVKGHALMYARALCGKTEGLKEILEAKPSGEQDTLYWYGNKVTRNGVTYAPVKMSDDPTLALYTLMFGQAMRESNGKYCSGYDSSAGSSSMKHDTAEASIYQTSWNANSAHPILKKLMAKDYGDSCQLETFKEGTEKACKGRGLGGIGDGPGVAFQAKAKTCPAFATEFAAVTMRKLRSHYGPLNRKEAEYYKPCEDLLLQVKKLVKDSPSVCAAL
jgi:hypothetical protein